jgi:tRNA threonylcarbamoyladenosine biosynthesis protein TsaE
VEWPEQCPDAVPENCLRIRITATGENSRQIEAEPCGNFRTIKLE